MSFKRSFRNDSVIILIIIIFLQLQDEGQLPMYSPTHEGMLGISPPKEIMDEELQTSPRARSPLGPFIPMSPTEEDLFGYDMPPEIAGYESPPFRQATPPRVVQQVIDEIPEFDFVEPIQMYYPRADTPPQREKVSSVLFFSSDLKM